ncbi:hypothetical protein C1J02_07585 [Sulfitobacter sp. SK011]|nr:hypothetical protein C1J02_07585 [Sulfitobacter sp. SK011]
METALKFVPTSNYVLLHGVSEKALIYSDDLDFSHKHIVLQEAAGMAEGNGRTFLRQLLSEGEAKYRTVESSDGGLNAKELHIVGPTGLMMTTTANSLHPEDASRMISIGIREDQDHMAKVLMAQALGSKSSLTDERIQEWRLFSEEALSKPVNVIIPFGGSLASKLPTSHFRIARDFPHVLSLIRTCAHLHRCNRDRAENGEVIATLADYEIVHNLVARPLSEGLESAVPANVREIIEAVRDLKKEARRSGDPISQRTLSGYLGRDGSVVSRNVAKAIELGYLKDNNPGQGRQSDLKLGELTLGDDKKVLPDVKDIAREELVIG